MKMINLLKTSMNKCKDDLETNPWLRIRWQLTVCSCENQGRKTITWGSWMNLWMIIWKRLPIWLRSRKGCKEILKQRDRLLKKLWVSVRRLRRNCPWRKIKFKMSMRSEFRLSFKSKSLRKFWLRSNEQYLRKRWSLRKICFELLKPGRLRKKRIKRFL